MAKGKITIESEELPYAMVPHATMRRIDLSWKAKGLFAYLMGMSKDWVIYKSDLAKRSSDGYDSMIKAWKELEDAGYIITNSVREKGLFKGFEYKVLRSPLPIGEKPESVSPEPVNPQLIITINKEEQLNNLNINEELKNSSEKYKKSTSVEADLKTKEDSAHHRIIAKFFKEMHDEFIFSPIHAKSVALLRKNITSLLKKHNRVADDQEVGDFALQLFDKLPSYYLDKDLAVINSKFNEIVLQIKNTTNGKSTGKQSTRATTAAKYSS